jgi:hypothetical protein
MTWISLAANRHEVRAVLKRNRDVSKRDRTTIMSSLLGRYAMLSGDETKIRREIEYAETTLKNFEKNIAPPNAHILSDVFDLSIIAGLGEQDFHHVIESIAADGKYKDKEDKTLQLVAQWITGSKKPPTKRYKRKGHVTTAGEWLKVVKEYAPEDVFNLAVTLDHPESSLLEKFILPLAYLLARTAEKDDWQPVFKQMVAWGSANLSERRNIVYERVEKVPEETGKGRKKTTARGFDAVELADERLFAYYYLGVTWEAILLIEEDLNTYDFLDNVKSDWKTVRENTDSRTRNKLEKKIDADDCTYVIVIDTKKCYAPESDLKHARRLYDLKIEIRDITEV